VQLWHAMNYHWYLKKEFQASALRQAKPRTDGDANDAVVALQWDAESPHLLRVFHADGIFTELSFCWDYSTISSGATASNPCLAGVVDGKHVAITPFRALSMPPPMSAYQLPHAVAVNEVTFSAEYNIATLLADGSLAFWSYGANEYAAKLPFRSAPSLVATVAYVSNSNTNHLSSGCAILC